MKKHVKTILVSTAIWSIATIGSFVSAAPFSENGEYEAAPAFDSPAAAVQYYEKEAAQQQKEEHAVRVFSENGEYIAAL